MTADTLTQVEVVIDVSELLDDGSADPGDVAHYVDQRIDGQDVAAAMIGGREVVALCGYRWVPWRDPRKLPVCRPCAEVLSRILRGGV